MPPAPTTLQAPACHAHLIAPGVLSGLEGIRYEVRGPASVFIPAGLPHSANVRAGTGFFVAIVLGVQEYDTAFGEG